MDVPNTRRIVLLGKAGAGKSSLANAILGEDVFKISHAPTTEKGLSHVVTKTVNGKSIKLIETPGFFDANSSEEEMKPEIMRCITECVPGPHAFLIVLKVEKFTEQEQAVIKKTCQHFSEEALKYATIVFTHGDQLPDRMKIEEFVSQNKDLSDLVKKCGRRCHVVDNKYWKNAGEDDYRSNQFQVAELLNTIDKMIEANKGGCYTNEMLDAVRSEITREEAHIRQSPGNMSQLEIRKKAKNIVFDRLWIRLAGVATGALLGALLGVGGMVAETLENIQDISDLPAAASAATKMATAALKGMIKGSQMGSEAAKGANSAREAIDKTIEATWK